MNQPPERATRDELLKAITENAHRFLQAIDNLRGVLDSVEIDMRTGLGDLDTDTPPRVIVTRYDVTTSRETLTDAVSEFTRARHSLRLSLFSLLIDEGMSSSEIAALWGFSKQMALKQMRKLDNLPSDLT